MVKLENVYFSYEGNTEILKNISLEIRKGKKTVFLGENGSGKSTLFMIMNGLLKADRGNVYLQGEKVIYRKKNLEMLRRKVGIVFQDPEIQIFAPTVFQEVSYGPGNLGYTKERIEEVVNSVLGDMDIEELKDKPCHHLSYGQKKRVSIASVMAMSPEVLILDEPTAWLDPGNIVKMTAILERLNSGGKTIVISTHDIDFAYEIADYIYILHKGEILREGEKEEVFSDFEFIRRANLNIPGILKFRSYLKERNIDMNDYYTFLKEKNLQ